MTGRRFLVGFACIAALCGFCVSVTECHAADETLPPINASGKGMTSAQLEQTRPILSGLKSINDAQQSVDEMEDKAKQILDVCTRTAPTSSNDGTDTVAVISGPFSHRNGKYFAAPKWKLQEINQGIIKQRAFLAENLSENQQDKRTLRASEATRQKIEALRAEARTLLAEMLETSNKLTAAFSAAALNQAGVADLAKDLIHSCKSVDAKLKEMTKVLQREQKNS